MCQDDLKFLEGRLLEEEKSKPQAERSEMTLLEKLILFRKQFQTCFYTRSY
jgi:asparaginyl-tRNA synthetase